MRRIVTVLTLICLISPCAGAQAISDLPSRVLLIRRESLKPGARMDHEKSEARWVHALERSKPRLALSSITGSDEVWFVAGYDSFAALEHDRQSQRVLETSVAVRHRYTVQEREFVSSIRSLTCVLAPEMSYRPRFDMAAIRYFRVRLTRVKPGHDGEYRELRKIINADEYEKPGRDIHVPVYHVSSGEPTGTYITLFPVKSPAEWDEPSPAMRQFLGADFDKVTDLMEKAVISNEDMSFEVRPAMSLPREEWVKENAEFWAYTQQSSYGTTTGAAGTAKPSERSRKR